MTRQEMFDFIISMYRENLEKGKDRNDCITILRHVLEEAYKKADYPFLKGKPSVKIENIAEDIKTVNAVSVSVFPTTEIDFPMKGEKITEDIKALVKAGYVNQVNYYYPTDYKGKITFGVTAPYSFRSIGINDFATPALKIISLMDGYHTGMLLNNHYFDNIGIKYGYQDILPFINDYVANKWQLVKETTGVKFKTETIIAHLNLFDYLD